MASNEATRSPSANNGVAELKSLTRAPGHLLRLGEAPPTPPHAYVAVRARDPFYVSLTCARHAFRALKANTPLSSARLQYEGPPHR